MFDYGSSREASDPYCLRAGEAASLLAGHPWKRFVVLGDSVAAGLGDVVEGYTSLPWCDRIAAELRALCPDLAYLNLGRRDLKANEVRVEQLDEALRFAPDLALVVCGGNDALRSAYRPELVDTEIETMIAALRDAGATVMTVGMFDAAYAPVIRETVRPLVSARMRRLSAHTAALAERMGAVHVNLTGHPAEGAPDIYSEDGLHGNMRAHAICAAEMIRGLGRHLRGGAAPDPAPPTRLPMMLVGPLMAGLHNRTTEMLGLVTEWAVA